MPQYTTGILPVYCPGIGNCYIVFQNCTLSMNYTSELLKMILGLLKSRDTVKCYGMFSVCIPTHQ